MTGLVMVTRGGGCGNGKNSSSKATAQEIQNEQQLSLVDFILAALRKSMVSCRVDEEEEVISAVQQMEIGWPTNVQHLTHVTFDRFHGFLGLPVEFEVEIPCRVPSASVSVFGVSAESMQCSYDTRGNSVPTILLLMQEHLYSQDGLKAEGIFRINPENSQEEHVRDQLNRGIVPEDIDVHCLAGLIKAWFRELPSGVLDGLSPEQVLQCNTEEEFVELVKQLKPTETALLNWAIDLMADVVEQEESNKMNARNIAMVFAPNMTQMSDPLTALMHAVQVMNLLKTLIVKTLRERGEAEEDGEYSPMSSCSSGRQTDEEFDSQQEMDTSCESAGPASDDDEHRYSYSSEERDEVESLSEIEESFLRQLDENEHAKNDFRKQLEGILCREHVISTATSTDNGDSSVLFSDSKIETSGLSTSDGEDSRGTSVTLGHKVESKRSTGACGSMEDVSIVDLKMVESAVPVQ
ncbi:rho GTPase-activating protein 2-like [Lycium ferocissimum]|uniref:rho GTPase-activating protein 2-like n=1 Tax=Lycium ferocissimum TaxID=112874 RepID=UPI0028162095|nr:rho GTPase-activating protein 2-like [Lycium ferocissimum]XP_059300935.1 rho GTPase-activating protein 2-like [Lycium ferocissimum]